MKEGVRQYPTAMTELRANLWKNGRKHAACSMQYGNHSSFLPSFLISFLPNFLPSFLPSFLRPPNRSFVMFCYEN